MAEQEVNPFDQIKEAQEALTAAASYLDDGEIDEARDQLLAAQDSITVALNELED